MYRCTLEKEGFLGTFYESAVPTGKAIILVGGSGEKRPFVEKRAQALRDEGFHVLALGYYLWEPLSTQTVRIPVMPIFSTGTNGFCCKNATAFSA